MYVVCRIHYVSLGVTKRSNFFYCGPDHVGSLDYVNKTLGCIIIFIPKEKKKEKKKKQKKSGNETTSQVFPPELPRVLNSCFSKLPGRYL